MTTATQAGPWFVEEFNGVFRVKHSDTGRIRAVRQDEADAQAKAAELNAAEAPAAAPAPPPPPPPAPEVTPPGATFEKLMEQMTEDAEATEVLEEQPAAVAGNPEGPSAEEIAAAYMAKYGGAVAEAPADDLEDDEEAKRKHEQERTNKEAAKKAGKGGKAAKAEQEIQGKAANMKWLKELAERQKAEAAAAAQENAEPAAEVAPAPEPVRETEENPGVSALVVEAPVVPLTEDEQEILAMLGLEPVLKPEEIDADDKPALTEQRARAARNLDRILERMADLEDRIAEAKAVHAERVMRSQLWLDSRVSGLIRTLQFHEVLLKDHFQHYPLRRGEKSVSLPGGQVGTREVGGGYEIEDKAAALEFARKNGITIKEEVLVSEIKKWHDSTGKPLPKFVRVAPKTDKFFHKIVR